MAIIICVAIILMNLGPKVLKQIAIIICVAIILMNLGLEVLKQIAFDKITCYEMLKVLASHLF